MATSPEISQAIRLRLMRARERERAQGKLLPEDDDFHETIRMKLDGRFDSQQFWNFSRCGHERIFRTCENCGDVQQFPYRCSLKWCPRCAWWICERRRKVLQLWSSKISQPKHLVLTQRNFPILTRKRFREHTQALAKMRRSKCFSEVRGGCVTVEVTNEQNGWHVHSHWLIDVRWLDMPSVARTWARLVGQSFAIVKIKDCRGKEYLREVNKYVCEGSELAGWPPEHILEFVTAIKGRRFFFPFGSLFRQGKEIRAELRGLRPEAAKCDCGCGEFVFEDETSAILNEIRKGKQRR